jgi:zinc protease
MRSRAIPALAAILLTAASSVGAQQALDRTKIPEPGPRPELRVPAWSRSTLANGAELVVSEKHDLPLVSFTITFLGGENQYGAAGKRGLASLTAAMLSEGTTTRDGEAISNALQLLGTSISANVGGESGSIGFVSTSSRFADTLGILADLLVNPTFPADSLERLRQQRLVALAQAKVQPAATANRVFPRVLYGLDHPYGQTVTEETTKAITRDDVVAFHRTYFKPGRALVTVVGDVRGADVKGVVDKALASWAAGGEKPSFDYPALPAPKPTTIYLVDKPGAAQSTFALGLPGPPRRTPDYPAIEVMNTILGDQFQSRLNANIREDKGYSYGVGSDFAFGKGPGAFRAGGDIVSDKSAAALEEFMKEFRGIRGARPVTPDELQTAKDAIVQRLPAVFASVSGINNAITSLWIQGLPDDYYQRYAQAVSAVTAAEVVQVATKYIDLDHMAIVIVGDKAAIEQPLEATRIAPVKLLDDMGAPLEASAPARR